MDSRRVCGPRRPPSAQTRGAQAFGARKGPAVSEGPERGSSRRPSALTFGVVSLAACCPEDIKASHADGQWSIDDFQVRPRAALPCLPRPVAASVRGR